MVFDVQFLCNKANYAIIRWAITGNRILSENTHKKNSAKELNFKNYYLMKPCHTVHYAAVLQKTVNIQKLFKTLSNQPKINFKSAPTSASLQAKTSKIKTAQKHNNCRECR